MTSVPQDLHDCDIFLWLVLECDAAIQPKNFEAGWAIPPPPWTWCVFGKVQTGGWLWKKSPGRPNFHALMCSLTRTGSQLQNGPKTSFLAKKLTKIWHFAWKDCIPNPLNSSELDPLCIYTGPTSVLFPILRLLWVGKRGLDWISCYFWNMICWSRFKILDHPTSKFWGWIRDATTSFDLVCFWHDQKLLATKRDPVTP